MSATAKELLQKAADAIAEQAPVVSEADFAQEVDRQCDGLVQSGAFANPVDGIATPHYAVLNTIYLDPDLCEDPAILPLARRLAERGTGEFEALRDERWTLEMRMQKGEAYLQTPEGKQNQKAANVYQQIKARLGQVAGVMIWMEIALKLPRDEAEAVWEIGRPPELQPVDNATNAVVDEPAPFALPKVSGIAS